MDNQELSGLYQRYGYLVHWRCLALTGNPADANDALQEVFLRLARYRTDSTSSSLGLLYTTASNVCFDLMKRKRREEPLEDAGPQVLNSHAVGSAQDGDIRARVGAVLRGMDRRSCEIGVLHYLDGFTQEEVAERTGFSRKTVGKKLKALQLAFRQQFIGGDEA